MKTYVVRVDIPVEAVDADTARAVVVSHAEDCPLGGKTRLIVLQLRNISPNLKMSQAR
jgi:hypothetical protein